MAINNPILYNAALSGALSSFTSGHAPSGGVDPQNVVAFAAVLDGLAPVGSTEQARTLMAECVATILRGRPIHGGPPTFAQTAKECKKLYDLMAVSLAVEAAGALVSHTEFFALMPGDNAATIAVGAPVLFPQNGPSNGAATRAAGPSPSNFVLAAGDYEVNWQVSVAEAGQLELATFAAGVYTAIANTVAGRATGTSQIEGSAIITATPAMQVSLLNPAGNSTALTLTPIAGGTHAVSATLTFKKLS